MVESADYLETFMDNNRTRIAVTGAAGRMGRRLVALAVAAEQLDLVAALEVANHPEAGKDAGDLAGVGVQGVEVGHQLTEKVDVLIDFSTPESTMEWLGTCRARNLPIVIGTTGLSPSQTAAVAEAAKTIPVIHTANYSVGVNVLLTVVGQVAKVLGGDYDIEISETHHRFKKDAPSGTALALAKAICEGLGKDPATTLVNGREGLSPRKEGEIGMHALRVGDTVGDHTIHFGNLGETVTIGHCAHTRDTFARGALRAAAWLAGKPAGLYTMKDVLAM